MSTNDDSETNAKRNATTTTTKKQTATWLSGSGCSETKPSQLQLQVNANENAAAAAAAAAAAEFEPLSTLVQVGSGRFGFECGLQLKLKTKIIEKSEITANNCGRNTETTRSKVRHTNCTFVHRSIKTTTRTRTRTRTTGTRTTTQTKSTNAANY